MLPLDVPLPGPSLVVPVVGVSEAGGGQRGSVLFTSQSNSVPSTMGPSAVMACVVVQVATCPMGTSSAPQVHAVSGFAHAKFASRATMPAPRRERFMRASMTRIRLHFSNQMGGARRRPGVVARVTTPDFRISRSRHVTTTEA